MMPRVWAPLARRLEIELHGRRHPMQQQPGGWWVATHDLEHGTGYAFCCDGGPARPDPRSLWQPDGVHAPSRCFDVHRFPWTDGWFRPPAWRSAILYELHIGTFTPEGTFLGAIAKLDHLVALGITHLEIMPIAAFPGVRGWGYDGVSLFAAHQPYGGPEGFQQLVDACHARGLAVVLDVVYNHLGPSGNYLSTFAPYFTHRYHTPWGEAINFDGPYSDDVRAFFLANAHSWLRDFHCDGLRLDAVHAIADTSARSFLEELADSVRTLESELGRELVLIAESDDNDPHLSTPQQAHGIGLTAQWNEDFHHALHAVLTGEGDTYFCDFGSLAALAATLTRGFYLDGHYSRFRQRRHGRPFTDTDAARLVVYAQNHDQTGNRRQGERLTQLVAPGHLRIAAALTLLGPGVPMLFQGEEFGARTPFLYFTDHSEPELAAAIRAGRPSDGADPQAEATFTQSQLRWDQQDESLLTWYHQLIRLRRESALADHDFAQVSVRYDEQQRWLAMQRGPWLIVCNFAREERHVPLPPGNWHVELESVACSMAPDSARLGPESAAVLRAG